MTQLCDRRLLSMSSSKRHNPQNTALSLCISLGSSEFQVYSSFTNLYFDRVSRELWKIIWEPSGILAMEVFESLSGASPTTTTTTPSWVKPRASGQWQRVTQTVPCRLLQQLWFILYSLTLPCGLVCLLPICLSSLDRWMLCVAVQTTPAGIHLYPQQPRVWRQIHSSLPPPPPSSSSMSGVTHWEMALFCYSIGNLLNDFQRGERI